MWSSSQIDEIKLSFVYFSAHLFSFLKNNKNLDNDWLVEEYMMENLMISNWEKLQPINNKIVLVVILAGKK